MIVAIPQPASVLFYQTDQLSSTRLLTDSAGVVRGGFSYDGFGNVIGSTGSYSSPLGWTGAYLDREFGLVYLIARYYDPVTGQLLSRDPQLSSTRAAYAYGSNNPLNTADPSGAIPVGVGGSGGGSTFPTGLQAFATLTQGPDGSVYWTAVVIGKVGNKSGSYTISLVDPSGDASLALEKPLNIYGANRMSGREDCSVGLWQLDVSGTGVQGASAELDVENCGPSRSCPSSPGIDLADYGCNPEFAPNPFEPAPPFTVPNFGGIFDPVLVPVGYQSQCAQAGSYV